MGIKIWRKGKGNHLSKVSVSIVQDNFLEPATVMSSRLFFNYSKQNYRI